MSATTHTRRIKFLVALMALTLLPACIYAPKFSTTKLNGAAGRPKALVMPVDVMLFEISMGGLEEPKAAWTESARHNIEQSLDRALRDLNISTVNYAPPNRDAGKKDGRRDQLLKLLGVIGSSIYRHYYESVNHLPAKKEFAWSLGGATRILRDEYGADYALFIYMRDRFSSGGRVALGVVTSALFGYIPQAGQQEGLAYLVDLHSGDVVWFHFLKSGGFGDAREPAQARTAIDALLVEFPK
ncbi:MAG: hypothetical protein HY580_05285 [Nitrospinae bacterium]|nr:hypothetical protein [Nitrospinota bacterium]